MPARPRSTADAFNLEVEALRLVAGCLTDQHLLLGPGQPDRAVGFRAPAPLVASGFFYGATLNVSLILRSQAEAPRPVVAGYLYRLLDRTGREHLSFHWHPSGARSRIAFPHLHVSAALRNSTPGGGVGVLPLDKIHIPTGHLSLADIVRLLVDELGVSPRIKGWRERLDDARGGLPAFPSAPS